MFTDHVKVINHDSGDTVMVNQSQQVLDNKTENCKWAKINNDNIRDIYIYKTVKVIGDNIKLPRLSETYINLL